MTSTLIVVAAIGTICGILSARITRPIPILPTRANRDPQNPLDSYLSYLVDNPHNSKLSYSQWVGWVESADTRELNDRIARACRDL